MTCSGNLAQGNWVPWEAEAANNNPELLVWRQDASCITTSVPGLYHLTIGFFTHSPVVIQVSRCLRGSSRREMKLLR